MAITKSHPRARKPATFSGRVRFGGDHLNPDEAITEASTRTRDAYANLLSAMHDSDDAATVSILREEANEARTNLVKAIHERLPGGVSAEFAGAQLADHAFGPIRDAVDQVYGPRVSNPEDPAWKRAGSWLMRHVAVETLHSDRMVEDFGLYPSTMGALIEEYRPDVHGMPLAMQRATAEVYDRIIDWLDPNEASDASHAED